MTLIDYPEKVAALINLKGLYLIHKEQAPIRTSIARNGGPVPRGQEYIKSTG